ncbi:hypothetical protein SteCoe_4764 [Stentor coeruleus]|uniref:Uncharacterized protein n=1 Tax=Stentor coeruleus TaxID=5963 RepID=A0A1R2CTU7_9CILI|nr:hypothetical protein SteCoe_4764 [Stentor coeruleus]
MKNKSFKWLLEALSESNIRIRVLSTYVLQSFLATDYFYNEDDILKHRKILYNLTNKEVIESINQDTHLSSKCGKHPIALGYSRSGRVNFTDTSLKEYLQNPHHNFTYIQKNIAICRESFDYYSSLVTLKEYSYEISIVKKSNEQSIKVKNKLLMQRLKDIMQAVVHVVELASSCKVRKLHLDFIKDDFDSFWLTYCHGCLVAQELKPVSEARTFRQLRVKEEIVQKGHFRIETPESSDCSLQSDYDLKPQITLKKSNSGKILTRANPDFIELICRNRAKYRAENKLQLPSLLFYAEPEEVKKEKEFIINMIEGPNLKFPKVERPRKSLWTKPIEARHFGFDSRPRQSSPMIVSWFSSDSKSQSPKSPCSP